MATAIRFDNVSKRYRLGSRLGDLREFVPDPVAAARKWWRRRTGKLIHEDLLSKDGDIWALKDVSFEVEEGEALGIIGPNGAGKSTILKLLAGITEPTRGRIETRGRLSALIEVGAGFHWDLTGRENVYLNGSILGLSKREIDAKFDSIVEFAELERFIDTPVKRYSSGMYVRLGFAVAAHLEPRVLLVDEVLAVGDSLFRAKCLRHMNALVGSGCTVLFVSHNLDAICRLCQDAIVLCAGEVHIRAGAEEAVRAYHDAMRAAFRKIGVGERPVERIGQPVQTGDAKIADIGLYDLKGRPIAAVRSGDPTVLRYRVQFHRRHEDPEFAMVIRRADGVLIYDASSATRNGHTGVFEAGDEASVEFRQHLPLAPGTYHISAHVTCTERRVVSCWYGNALSFEVVGVDLTAGLVSLQSAVEVDGSCIVPGWVPAGSDEGESTGFAPAKPRQRPQGSVFGARSAQPNGGR